MNKEELIEIAQMAKLSLTSEEVEELHGSISDVLGMADTISDVDLSEYDCSDEMFISELREDVVKPSVPVELLLSSAAVKRDDFFIV